MKTKKLKAAATIQGHITNLDFLRQCTSGDEAKMSDYIKLYLKSASALLDKLKASIGDRKWDDIRSSAHSLKPLLTYVGIETVSKELEGIEKNALTKTNLKAIANSLGKVESVCEDSFIELQAILKTK